MDDPAQHVVHALPKRIAVTGAAGFLGAATVRRLAALPGVELVAAIDNQPSVVAGGTMPVVSVIRDVRDPLDGTFRDYEIGAVVHLAYMLRTSRDRPAAWSVNVGATGSLLEACAAAGVRQVVYLSSTTVYGAHGTFTRPYRETDPANPVKGFQYSEHKAEAESLLLRHAAGHPETAIAILRGCVVMAPGADNFIARSLGRRTLPVPAGADPEMQFLHMDDCVSAVEAALTRRARGVYNIAGDGTVRWREMVRMTGGRLLPVPVPLLAGVVGLAWRLRLQDQSPACGINFIRHPWLADTEKIKTELGWRPLKSSRDALQSWVDGRRAAG